MALEYKISEVSVGDIRWTVKEFRDRDQFPTESEKVQIGVDAWGSGVPESLWPLSGILWPSGKLLAELVDTLDLQGKRVLEVGCGVALASMVLKRRGVEVTASDYNPFAGELLRENAKLNKLDPPDFCRLSWQDAFVGRPFDVVIGSDVLYEPGCAAEVCDFLKTALAPNGTALFVDPGRAHVRKFETTLQAAGFSCEVEWPIVGQKTRILRIGRGA